MNVEMTIKVDRDTAARLVKIAKLRRMTVEEVARRCIVVALDEFDDYERMLVKNAELRRLLKWLRFMLERGDKQ